MGIMEGVVHLFGTDDNAAIVSDARHGDIKSLMLFSAPNVEQS